MKTRPYGFALFFCLPGMVWAWGAEGHEAVALIAQKRLTAEARQRVQEILGPGEDMFTASTWADPIAHVREETAPWHYFDLDPRKPETPADIRGVCPNHDCVVDQILKDEGILRAPSSSRRDKREALKFLIHFLGDIHQPLHCVDDHDRGGNDKWFRYHWSGGRSGRYQWVNLHGLWDRMLRPKGKGHPGRLAKDLVEGITDRDGKDWCSGGPQDWGFESFLIARDRIYKDLPSGPLPKSDRQDLPLVYYGEDMRRLAERQVQKAGVRLAWVLNGLFQKP